MATKVNKLFDALTLIANLVEETGISVNICSDGLQIHWNGVNQLDCSPWGCAKALPLLKQLEVLGMKDC